MTDDRPEPLPMTANEIRRLGWDAPDVVFVSGDAYVDHPSFAGALLGRVLQAAGFRVAILAQPDWRSADPWREMGRPKICYAVSAGNLDSMLNHYTAGRKIRNDDAYSPGGRIGLRPDRATAVYCQRAREAFRDVPIIAGGIEASMRRLAHYDFWSDKIRRSILLDSKADLLAYGMGESTLTEIVRRLDAGELIADLRNMPGVAYRLGASEPAPEADEHTVVLPDYDELLEDRTALARMTRTVYAESNPECGRRLVQRFGRETVVVNRPADPLPTEELDRIYELPFTGQPHPSYGDEKIPALEIVETSIPILRGCAGGCRFCSLTLHQGKRVTSRSEESVIRQIKRMAADPDFKGTISDLGGPTANMYRMHCMDQEARKQCRRPSCLFPSVCKNLDINHGPVIKLMRAARDVEGVKRVLIASGVRMDLAIRNGNYIRELVGHHVGGLLKVAPEHVDPDVLRAMGKPPVETFELFERAFNQFACDAGLKRHIIPYFIAGHPGCDLGAMIRLAQYLKRHDLKPEKVQDFIPLPMTWSAAMYYSGVDPADGRPVHVARGDRERRLQRALLQWFMPRNWKDVRDALIEAGREDLIGPGPDCLIPAKEPAGARRPRRGGKKEKGGKPPGKPGGYRPGRAGARRRKRHE